MPPSPVSMFTWPSSGRRWLFTMIASQPAACALSNLLAKPQDVVSCRQHAAALDERDVLRERVAVICRRGRDRRRVAALAEEHATAR